MRINTQQLRLYASEYFNPRPLPQSRPAPANDSQTMTAMTALFLPALYHPGAGAAPPGVYPGFLLDRYI
ncbi:MAG: hypothetical protein LBJ14_03890 [Desulfarculales bacterium]|jgi:hypothetical protein|nr:hypothetical protein [Desulfarculales bacterium]